MSYSPPKIVSEAIKRWDECKTHHDLFVRAYERRERSYRGILASGSDAAKWRHKHTPMYAFNLIETIVANTIEMGLRFEVKPAPHSQAPLDEVLRMARQADVVGELLRHEHRVDEMEYKQRPLFLSAAIGGIGVGKSYWNYTTGSTKKQGMTMRDVHGPDGSVMLQVPQLSEIETNGVIRDHSTFEVVDPRDFVLHESAKALQPFDPGGAQYLFHRCWYSFEQLKMMERAGFVRGVDKLKESLDFSSEYVDRETQLWNINRTKDLIEVLEYWKMEDGVVKRVLVGNRMALLRDLEANPFHHGEYPFIVSSSMPQLFTTKGVSDMELIEELQSMLWEIGNQRLDNVELINNWITLIRSDIDDPEAFQHYPGAQWPVESTNDVETLMPPFQLIDATLNAEAGIRTDLQNVTSAAPFAGGTQLASIQQNTATGASIVMNAAQQRMMSKKYQAQQGLKQEATMRIKNCQQFVTDDRLLHVLGKDGQVGFREISPLDIQGEYVAELEPMGESNMRQERRAEALQLGQIFMQWAPLMAAAGAPVSVEEIFKWVAKRWGLDDADRFFSQKPAAAGAMAAPGGPAGDQGAAAPPPGAPNLGITAGAATDASSPSAAGGVGGSPVQALQRALAMSGGPANA